MRLWHSQLWYPILDLLSVATDKCTTWIPSNSSGHVEGNSGIGSGLRLTKLYVTPEGLLQRQEVRVFEEKARGA